MLSEEKEVLEYIKEAFSLRSRELYKPAVEMLYKALALDNDNIEVLYQLGELYALMQNHTRAAGYLDQVITKDPGHTESLRLYKQISEDLNDFEKALSFAEKLFELNKNREDLKEIIRLAGKLKLTDKIKAYQTTDFTNSDVIYEIAKALYDNGEIQEAKKILTDRQNDDSENIKVLLGKIYFDENDLEKSREIFESFGKNTDNTEVLNYQGLFALEDMNFTDLARRRYSVRKYSDKPIEREKLNRILAAGMLAPTAKNQQPQKIYVVQSKENIDKLAQLTHCGYGSPTVLIFAYDLNEDWKNPL